MCLEHSRKQNNAADWHLRDGGLRCKISQKHQAHVYPPTVFGVPDKLFPIRGTIVVMLVSTACLVKMHLPTFILMIPHFGRFFEVFSDQYSHMPSHNLLRIVKSFAPLLQLCNN